MDTPMVNGTAYPYLTVQPKAYRFRILNATNDRMWNLQLYRRRSHDHRRTGFGTEVKMVPAVPGAAASRRVDGPDARPAGRHPGRPRPAACPIPR